MLLRLDSEVYCMTSTLTVVTDAAPPSPLPSGLSLPPLRERWLADGKRWMRELPVPVNHEARFTGIWKVHKVEFMRRGFSVRQHNEQWILQQALCKEGAIYTLTPAGQEKLDIILQPDDQPFLFTKDHELTFDPLNKELESKLLPHQIQPARQIYRAVTKGRAEWGYPGAADLSDMGTGKTYQNLAVAIQTGLKVCVLCPVVGRSGWEKAFAHFGVTPLFIESYEAVRGNWRSHICTQDAHGNFTWHRAREIILILDEIQSCRHEASLTSRCCAGAVMQGIPILIASATVATSPMEMRFAGRITGLHKGADDYRRFLIQHGCFRKKRDGPWEWDKNLLHLRKIHARLFPHRGARVRKEDLGEDCPETEINVLPFDVSEGAEIQHQWREALEMIDNLKKQRVKNAGQLEQMRRNIRMRVWHRCERALVDSIADRAKEDLKAGRSVAIFMNFTDTRMAMSRLLNTTAGFYGGQNPTRRAYYEAEFQANRIRVLVSQIKAGGASVSLQDLTGDFPRSSYVFPTDDPVVFKQAFGRVDRVKGKTKSLQWIPCIAGAMTQQIVDRARQKMMRIATINDGKLATTQF